MKYGIIQIKICSKNHEWIKYCNILSVFPESYQNDLKHVNNDINKKYFQKIIIPINNIVHPGCVVKAKCVKIIANYIYDQYTNLTTKYELTNSVRCVYGIGELESIDAKSIGNLYHYPILIQIGRYLDSSDNYGIFEVN